MGCLSEVRGLFEGDEDGDSDGTNGSDEQGQAEDGREAESDAINVLSLGGGAGSELLALASLIRGIRGSGHRYDSSSSNTYRPVRWTGVDIGSWSSVLDTIGDAVQHTWKGDITRTYHKTNLLDASSPSTQSLFDDLAAHPPHLTTLFFTLTELLSQSPQRTIALLTRLTAHTPRGGYLLVADSASDISSFSLGAGGREWPTYTMIDLIMLRLLAADKKGDQPGQWEKVESSDSRWYRLAPGTGSDWPTKLENARYWFRLYRRI
jgi:25S rRNA (uracil2843-N3)-methyltransferase